MRKSWYPIAFSKDVKGNEPYGIALLGDPLVLFRNTKGVLQCLSDKCPHRSAALSDGLIKNGELECLYHGWRFGDGGQCTHIPSISGRPSKANDCSLPYPVLELFGWVWVWPTPGDPEATEDKIPKEAFPELLDPAYTVTLVQRDLNAEHGLMVENLTDPAHVPYTHKSTIGRFEGRQTITMEVKYDTTKSTEQSSFLSNEPKRPPYVPKNTPAVVVDVTHKERPEWKRTYPMTFIAPYITRFTQATSSQGFFFPQRLLPTSWFQHFNQIVVDEDMALIAGQQRNILKGADPWQSAVSADKLGVRYRKWRNKQEAEGVWFRGFDATEDMEDLKSEKKREGLDYGGKDFHPVDRTPPLIPSPPSWVVSASLSVGVMLAVKWTWDHRGTIWAVVYKYVKVGAPAQEI